MNACANGARITPTPPCPRICDISKPLTRPRRHSHSSRLALVLWLVTSPAAAVDQISITAERVEGQDWHAEQLSLQAGLDDRGRIEIGRLQLPEPIGMVSEASIDCPKLEITPQKIVCTAGTASLPGDLLGAATFPVSFSYTAADRALHFRLSNLPTHAGRLNFSGHYSDSGWQISASGEQINLERLATLAAPLLDTLRETTISGQGSLDAELAGSGTQLTKYRVATQLNVAALDAMQSRLAAENLSANIELLADTRDDEVHFDINIEGKSGQLYADPVLADFSAHPGTAQLSLIQQVDALTLTQASVDLRDAVSASIDGRIQIQPDVAVAEVRIEANKLQFPGAYSLLQPFLIGTPVDSLETLGFVHGAVVVTDNQPTRIDLNLSDLHVDDLEGRYALFGASGELHWAAQEAAPPSQLSWEGGELYRVALDASRAHFKAGGGHFELLKPLNQPMLDGGLNISQFRIAGMGRPDMRVRFNAEVAPINLTKLTRALGWPEFGGTLSGRLPALEYANNVLALEGALTAEVFDGNVAIREFRIEDPFGDFPVLFANLRARNLDLKQATDTFSFGRIQGRFNADVEGLKLYRWQPVAFDAQLYTPPASFLKNEVVYRGEVLLNDKPHRISQRAIENISDIGGSGASGVLSRGFLGFFEDFAYDQISLGCRLANGVCHMQGLEPKGDGYYIVKGRLLPRIDVIGFAREVSWPDLLEQLQNISSGEGPVVQ